MSGQHDTAAIQALVDGTLDATGRARLEAHLATCEACRRLADDLREIRRAARALPPAAAPERVWLRLAEQLGAQVADRRAPRRRLAARSLAVAATAVVAVAAALVVLRRPSPGPAPAAPGAEIGTTGAGNAAPQDLVQAIEADLDAAERHYAAALASLERMAQGGGLGVERQVAETLRANVALVDRAIADSREALRADPQSQPARESLIEALRRKVALLHDTIALVGEMWRGNQAGAVAIADSLKPS